MFTDILLRLLQANLGVPAGTIKATVLIETLPAAFEMDEILYELRHHSAGLNCGRWDYIFSFIKTMRADPSYIMPDRCAPRTSKDGGLYAQSGRPHINIDVLRTAPQSWRLASVNREVAAGTAALSHGIVEGLHWRHSTHGLTALQTTVATGA